MKKNVLQRRNLTLRVRLLGEKFNRLYENLIGDLLLQFSLMLTYFKLFICNEDSIVLPSISRSVK